MLYSLGDDRVSVGKNVFIAPGSHVMGKVILADNSSVWFNAVLRGDCDVITIGVGSNVQDGSVLHTDFDVPLTVGSPAKVIKAIPDEQKKMLEASGQHYVDNAKRFLRDLTPQQA